MKKLLLTTLLFFYVNAYAGTWQWKYEEFAWVRLTEFDYYYWAFGKAFIISSLVVICFYLISYFWVWLFQGYRGPWWEKGNTLFCVFFFTVTFIPMIGVFLDKHEKRLSTDIDALKEECRQKKYNACD